MTIVEVQCPDCDAVKVPSTGIGLLVSPRVSLYSFTCPLCGGAVQAAASDRDVSLLMSAGVRAVAAPVEVSTRLGGDVLSEDDEIAFGRALEAAVDVSDAALSELARGGLSGVPRDI